MTVDSAMRAIWRRDLKQLAERVERMELVVARLTVELAPLLPPKVDLPPFEPPEVPRGATGDH